MQSSFNSRQLLARTLMTAAMTLALAAATGATAKAHEHHGEHHGDNGNSVYLNRDVHPTATNSYCPANPGQLWQGAGNAPTTFQRVRNVKDGIELGLKAVLRSVGGDFPATYVDDDGVVHIEVPSGSQTDPSPQTNRAKWNFAYSVDVGLNAGKSDTRQIRRRALARHRPVRTDKLFSVEAGEVHLAGGGAR